MPMSYHKGVARLVSPGALRRAEGHGDTEMLSVKVIKKNKIRFLPGSGWRLAGILTGLAFVGAIYFAHRYFGDSAVLWAAAAWAAALTGLKIGAIQDNLRRQTVTDPLTGLYNRRHLFKQFGHELERAKRYQSAVSLLILDIDGFKKINDTMGHLTGDAILRQIARVIKGAIRRTDWAARWGGEEFAVVLPATGCSAARQMAERVRREIETRVQDILPPSKRRPVTVSIGFSSLSCSQGDHEGIDEIITRADQAMYRAKRWGNHVSNKCHAPWDSCGLISREGGR